MRANNFRNAAVIPVKDLTNHYPMRVVFEGN